MSVSGSNCSAIAEVVVIFNRPEEKKYKVAQAQVFVSNRLYWKEIAEDSSTRTYSLIDFCNADSLELNRLNEGSWETVEGTVEAVEWNGKSCIIVPGYLHGPLRQKHLFPSSSVKVVLVPKVLEQREAWLEQIRARIAPWKLLQQRIRAFARQHQSADVEKVAKGIGRIIVDNSAALPARSFSETIDEIEWTANFGNLLERMEKLNFMDELSVQTTAVVETASTLVKLVSSAQCIKETAEFVADAAKCVPDMSTVFQLVVISARIVSMYAEANQGCRVLSVALCRILILLRYVLRSLTEIMNPSLSVELIHEDVLFDVLKQTVDIMDTIETQFLLGKGSRLLNAKVVKEMETTMTELEWKVVTVSNISKTSVLSEKVTRLEIQARNNYDEPHHVRPEISPFFVGRKKELEKLSEILRVHGSAVITQYGGAGKSELMVAFAARAEHENKVPGGVFWVAVDGKPIDVLDSLVRLVEKFTRRKICDEDRRNASVVVELVKAVLARRKERWLLCLDNADNSDIVGILDAVCGIAVPSRDNGWILVTSRLGSPRIWNRMKECQKLMLQSLNEVDSMVVLWRQIHVIENGDADDEVVMAEINKLKQDNRVEYDALKELCEMHDERNLGGLPLALVQAGAYIRRYKCSFEEYKTLFKKASKKEDLDNIMESVQQLTSIREEQKAVMITWRISVERLSDVAYAVLRGLAMYGQSPVTESIVKGILKAVKHENESVSILFRNVFVKELVQDSSLICREEGEKMGAYGMHRLVRRFILRDMERSSFAWKNAFSVALISLHEGVEGVLEKEKRNFSEAVDYSEERHREFVPHVLALIEHFVVSTLECDESVTSKLEDILRYGGHLLRFLGRVQEEVQSWRSLLTVLHHQYGKDKENADIASVYCELGGALRNSGKIDEASDLLHKGLQMSREVHGHDSVHPNIANSMSELGNLYHVIGKFDEAVKMYERSIEMQQAIYGEECAHPSIAISLSNLATVYHDQGRLDEARKMHERSIEMQQAIYGEECAHPDIAISLKNLGTVYHEQGKLDEAVKMYERSIEMNQAIYGEESAHPNIATNLDNLGTVYHEQGKLDEAVKMYERSFVMKKAIYGEECAHPSIATSLSNLGTVYHDQGRLDEARKMHERSIEMQQAIYGEESAHPNIAISLKNLGRVYRDEGKLDEAMKMYTKSIEMQQAIHGEESAHPNIATNLDNLGTVYHEQGKLDEAVKMYERSFVMKQAIYGEKCAHPSIATSLSNLGTVYHDQGKLDQALKMHEKSIKMQQAIHGEECAHPDIATSFSNLGTLHHDQGKLEEAVKMYERSIEMRQAIYGEESAHPDIATSLDNLGLVYHDQGKLEEAVKMYEWSIEMQQAIYGEEHAHPSIATSLSNLGRVYRDQGKLEEAMKINERSIEMKQAIYGEECGHSEIVTYLSNLRTVYHDQEELEEAVKMYEKSIKAVQVIHGGECAHPNIAIYLSNLGTVFHDQGKLEEAVKMHKKSIKMDQAIYGEECAHPDIAISLDNLGRVYRDEGKLDEAMKMYTKSFEMEQAIHGEECLHPNIAICLSNLGTVYYDQGKLDEAANMYERSIKMGQAVYGEGCTHPSIAISLGNLGIVYHDQGKLDEAVKMYERSIEMQQAIYGEECAHPDIVTCRNNLELAYQDRGKLKGRVRR